MRLLKDVKIGKLVQNIDENAFKDQINLETVSLNSNYIIKNSNLKNIFGNQVKYYIIEDDINSSIGQKAFCECTNLESLIIGKNVPGIGKQALYGCTSLSSIEIPNNIKNIDASALANCGSDSKPLNIIFESENPKINLVDSNSNIIYAFGEINSDGNLPIKIYVPINFEEIYAEKDDGWKYYSQFINNFNINIFYYNDGSIGRTYDTTINSVVNKPNLIKVHIGSKVTSIGDYAFGNCFSLNSVSIGDGVISIGEGAFINCSSLNTIEIPNGITSIGNGAFKGCKNSNLTSVAIPDNVISIGWHAFEECANLRSVMINSDAIINKEYNYHINHMNIQNIFGEQVKDYIIGNNVKGIGDYAFCYCSSLTSVTIPNSVTSIGESAFERCSSLTSVMIPNSVASIGEYAFSGCGSLKSVVIEAETPPTLGNQYVFKNTNNCPIYVPSQSVDVYKATENWANYVDRIYAISK